jgi:hypothetical protein
MDQPTLLDVPTQPKSAKPPTVNQQVALGFIRQSDGATATEIGQQVHAHGQSRRHSLTVFCKWCESAGRQTAASKALKALVTYSNLDGQRVYRVRDPRDRVRHVEAVREPTEAEIAADPFAGLGQQ